MPPSAFVHQEKNLYLLHVTKYCCHGDKLCGKVYQQAKEHPRRNYLQTLKGGSKFNSGKCGVDLAIEI